MTDLQLNRLRATLELRTQEADDLRAELAKLRDERDAAENGLAEACVQLACTEQERDALAATVDVMRGYLDRLSRLGSEPHKGDSISNAIAQQALDECADPTDILATRDARVKVVALREAQAQCIDYAENAERDTEGTLYGRIHANTARALANEIGRMADAIEKGGA